MHNNIYSRVPVTMGVDSNRRLGDQADGELLSCYFGEDVLIQKLSATRS